MSLRRWIFASELLSDLRQQGIELWLEEDRLRYRTPSGALSPEHREVIVEFKQELLDILRDTPQPHLTCTIRSFIFNSFRQKCYVCHSKGEAVIIDPGCSTDEEQRAVVEYLEQNNLSLTRILLTHAHVDHLYGAAFFARRFQRSFLLHADDTDLLSTLDAQAKLVDSTVEAPPEPEGFLRDGDEITFGDVTFRALHCPGHSPGSLCYYDTTNELLITGDVLFRGTVGNMFMPGGSLSQLLDSINKTLLPLPEGTLVHPGHGPATTIGRERSANTWLPIVCSA